MNPIIYCVRTKQFRVAFIKILLKKSSRKLRVSGSLNSVAMFHKGEERMEGKNEE